MDATLLLWLSLLLGVLTPLASPCVLILYPGYIAFLAGRSGKDTDIPFSPVDAAVIVASGVIAAMLAGGFVFTALIQSLGGLVRTIATLSVFLLLFILSLLLVLGIDFSRIVKVIPVPRPENPKMAAFLYGILFGILILPCNAASIAVLLALSATAGGFWEGMGSFLAFGVGITLPLLVLGGISQARSRQIMQYIQSHERPVQVVAGLIMLALSVWYLGLFFLQGW
jgi:cytochrome c-type biogenesis protein